MRAARLRLAAVLAALAVPALAATPRAAAAPAAPAELDGSWVRVGVIVASRQGLEGDRPLRFAYRDGEKLERMLATVGQIEPANLFFLKLEKKASLKTSLAGAGARIAGLKASGKKVFLQFYYTGHGAARHFHFGDGRFSFDEARTALGGDQADARVYVLDVCYGASFFNSKGFATAPPVQLKMDIDRSARGEVMISSSAVDEQAYEVKTLGGSIFTSHWIMALRGAGDRNRDGQVTLFEAYNYAYDRTAGYSAETLARPQHPSFQMDLTGARDVMLARFRESSTGLVFQGCPAGRYEILDLQRGLQIGELRLPPGEEFSLALEPGRYRVQHHAPPAAAVAADVDLQPGGLARLPFHSFTAAAAAAGVPKGPGFVDDDAPVFDPEPYRKSRLGYGMSAWFGVGGFLDEDLYRDLDERPEVDRAFGLQGAFRPAGPRTTWGFEAGLYSTHHWYGGWRMSFSQNTVGLSARGRENLVGVSDSLRDAYTVTLESRYTFRDFFLGPYVGRSFPLGGSQALALELGLGWAIRNVEGKRTLNRPLYNSTLEGDEKDGGQGYRLEAGATWWVFNAVPGARKKWGAALRVAPHLQTMEPLDLAGGDTRGLDSRELGFSVSLLVSFVPSRFTRGILP